jgi:heavy metal sensor kinase
MNFIHSIKFRFTIWYLLVLAVLLSILGVSVYFFLSRSLYRNLDHDLELRTTQLQNIPTIISSIREGEFQEEVGEIVLLCYYSEDKLVQISPRDVSISLEYKFIEQAIEGNKAFDTVRTTEGKEIRLCAVPLEQSGHQGMMSIGPAAVVVGRSAEDIEQALDRLVRIFIIAGPLTLLLAAGGGVFLAGRALKPVDEISQTARNIGEGDLNQRIEVNTKDELGRLAATLNQMIERLQKALKRQQQLTSDASHELRAPLAVIQAESSLALQKEREAGEYKQSLETVTQEASHMSSIIDRLLVLARADAGKVQLVFEEVNLGNLIRDLSDDVEILCQQKGLVLEKGATPDFIVKGDRSLLRQLFLNLLDNAIRYTPGGGTISVTFSAERQRAAVAIADTGIGIPPEDLPHIFERFYRVDKARSRAEGSSGLGLSICQYIAEVHGGKTGVESQPGKGSTFTVWLPGRSPA